MARNKDTNTLFSSGDAARKVGCSRDALVHYEKTGKIKPARLSNGERIYTHREINIARGLFGKRR